MTGYSKALVLIHQLIKLYQFSSEEVCESFGITRAELDIISFLHNNPGMDTAKMICEIRFLKKSIVSQSIDKLVKRGFVKKRADADDRRLLHLSLTPDADECVDKIDEMQKSFFNSITSSYTAEEKAGFAALIGKLEDHMSEISEEQNHG